ncbi:hypothetical protein D3K11_23455 [Salmonella enterica]|nr:hypothetical protein [Salmonella enterica]EBY2986092.1 hypothetical protein [Salmonella enterica subsp. enterica serovar Durban]ECC9158740.1 hypothetical protein [Salmonella enterica subsp. salamae]ECV3919469.1 hypothetical protein [Salmonella enterica subsp. enterica serovar O rough]
MHKSGYLFFGELLLLHTISETSAAMRGMLPKNTALPSVSGLIPGRLRALSSESRLIRAAFSFQGRMKLFFPVSGAFVI